MFKEGQNQIFLFPEKITNKKLRVEAANKSRIKHPMLISIPCLFKILFFQIIDPVPIFRVVF